MESFTVDSIKDEMSEGQGFVATLFASWAHAAKF